MFNVTGSGAQNAATFQVGQVVFNSGDQQGGGITQTVTLPGGSIGFSANIAALGNPNENAEGGVFSVLFDGVTEDTADIGVIGPNAVIRNTLSFTATESAGPHTLEILITRPFLNGVSLGETPEQFITNIAITGAAAVPEPSSLGLLAAGLLGLAGARHRRRAGSPDRN
ncbi:MAG: PEP-CTERM sorting domain-containing protein [Stellaceae bacterium]